MRRDGETSVAHGGTRRTSEIVVVSGADDFFGRIAPENWPCTSRMLPLSVAIPVPAGVGTVSGHPENWIGKLMSAAAPPHRANLRNCLEALASSDDA